MIAGAPPTLIPLAPDADAEKLKALFPPNPGTERIGNMLVIAPRAGPAASERSGRQTRRARPMPVCWRRWRRRARMQRFKWHSRPPPRQKPCSRARPQLSPRAWRRPKRTGDPRASLGQHRPENAPRSCPENSHPGPGPPIRRGDGEVDHRRVESRWKCPGSRGRSTQHRRPRRLAAQIRRVVSNDDAQARR